MINKHLYALVPGFNSYNQQEKYIDKSMKLFNLNSIKIGGNKYSSRRISALNANGVNKDELEMIKFKNKHTLSSKLETDGIVPQNQSINAYYSPQKL